MFVFQFFLHFFLLVHPDTFVLGLDFSGALHLQVSRVRQIPLLCVCVCVCVCARACVCVRASTVVHRYLESDYPWDY
jgi:hypothetical protein